MRKYAIQRIHLRSALKFGLLIGPIVMFLPGLLLALLTRWSISALSDWLGGWNRLDLGLVNVNVLELVNLSDFLQTIQNLDGQGVWLLLMITVGSMILGAIQGGLLVTFGAIVYNIFAGIGSGLVVSAELLDRPVGSSPVKGPLMPTAREAGEESRQRGAPNSHPLDSLHTPVIPLPVQETSYNQVTGGRPKQNDLPMRKYSAAPRSAASPSQVAAQRASSSFAQYRPGAWLISRQNPQRRLRLKMGRTTIGSAPNNHIVLNGLALRHAEMHFQNNHSPEGPYYILHDLSNGQTSVNGRTLVGPNLLKDGFLVRLGNDEFIFQAT